MNKIQKTKFLEEKADSLGVSMEDYEHLLSNKSGFLEEIIYSMDSDIQESKKKEIFNSKYSLTKYGKYVALLSFGIMYFSMYFRDAEERKAVLDKISDKGDKPVRLAYLAYLAYHQFGDDALIYRVVEGCFMQTKTTGFSVNRHDGQVTGVTHEKMVKIYDGIDEMQKYYKSNSLGMRLEIGGMQKKEPVSLFS